MGCRAADWVQGVCGKSTNESTAHLVGRMGSIADFSSPVAGPPEKKSKEVTIRGPLWQMVL
jgi:hypothetical protein